METGSQEGLKKAQQGINPYDVFLDTSDILADSYTVSRRDVETAPKWYATTRGTNGETGHIFPAGGFISVVGQAKAGKTSFLAAAIGQVLRREQATDAVIIPVKENLPEDGARVCWIDTEQRPAYLHNVMRIVQCQGNLSDTEMWGVTDGEGNVIDPTGRRFEMFSMKAVPIGEMWPGLISIIRSRRPNILVVDGIADFLLGGDINSVQDSVSLVKNLLELQEDEVCKNTTVICVLHTNETESGFYNSKPRGHLGAELARKGEGVIRVANIGDESIPVKEIKSQSARGIFGLTPIYMRFSHEGPVLQNRLDNAEARKKAAVVFTGHTIMNPMKAGDAVAAIMRTEGIAERQAKSRLADWLSWGIISKTGKSLYYIEG